MTQKEKEQLAGLLDTMRLLRSEQGCPWDRQQTPESLCPYILEEAYELVDAIERGDEAEILAELGDLLLQIVFQARIYQERGRFGLGEIAAGIDRKLKRRHPHIFAPQSADDEHPSWDQIKQAELSEQGKPTDFASRVPRNLPALKLADKLARHQQDRRHAEARLPIETSANKGKKGALDERQLASAVFSLVKDATARGLDTDLALRKYLFELLDEEKISP